ncbi:MAG: pyridoxal 5'-phosphate synthase glutaminase subunit PdxT [Micromonosporaceae bacterium]
MGGNTPAIGVLALQGDVREHLRALRESGARSAAIRRPGELDAVDGLVIPGGESTTIWKLATAFELMEPVRKRIAAGMPAFGSCAGMIMLADRVLDGAEGQETFGGIDMTVRRNAFGRQVDSFEAELAIKGIVGPAFRGVFIRAPWVESVGPAVEVLGRDDSTGRIVAVRQGPLLATSFHPELTGDVRVHRLFADIVKGRS